MANKIGFELDRKTRNLGFKLGFSSVIPEILGLNSGLVRVYPRILVFRYFAPTQIQLFSGFLWHWVIYFFIKNLATVWVMACWKILGYRSDSVYFK